jgi:hypothetical protein
MEMWLAPALGWDFAAGTAQVLGSGEQRVSCISPRDVVTAIVACVDNQQAQGQTIERPWTGGVHSARGHRTRPVAHGPRARGRARSGRGARAAGAGGPGGTDAAIFPSLMLCQTRGDEIAAAPEWLRPQTTVEDYLRTVLNRAPGGRPRPSRHSRRRNRLRSLPHSGHDPGGRLSYVTRRSPRNPDQGA